MVISGKKKWIVLILISLLSGVMVYVPYLRYSYYDQMVLLFTQYKPIVDAANVNEFIGDFSFWLGLICMIGYPIGGVLVDKFGDGSLYLLVWHASRTYGNHCDSRAFRYWYQFLCLGCLS